MLWPGAAKRHEGRARHVLLETEQLADLLERRHEKLVAHQGDRREHAASGVQFELPTYVRVSTMANDHPRPIKLWDTDYGPAETNQAH